MWTARRRLLQLQNEVFAFDQKKSEFFTAFLLVEFFDIIEFHGLTALFDCADSNRDLATTSATLMPSTPAERMPPA